MTELYFRLGNMEGFTSNTTADKKEGFGIPIRELMQNSLDATPDGKPCNVDIVIEEISIDDVPHIDDYQESLQKAIRTQTELGSYGNQQKQVVNNLESELNKRRIRILMFADDGAGMDRDTLTALIEHRSKKPEPSGGSFGVGHLRPYDLSSLRYILYVTRHKGGTQFTGVPILAGFQDDDGTQRGNIGRIVGKRPTDENNPVFDYPDRVPSFFKRIMGRRGRGTVVCILGLSDKWENDCALVIASHFFSAILYDRLSVRVQWGGEKETALRLDSAEAERVLMESKEGRRTRASRGEILSGQHTWQSFQAVKDSNSKEIELSNGDRVSAYIHTEDIATSSVALIRSDMLVARHDTMLSSEFDNLRKSDSFAPFALVIDINKSQSGKELFDLIKAAEGPYHNRLTRGELSAKDYDRLRTLLRELAEKVKEYLPKADREGFDLPIFNSIAASISNNRKAKPAVRSGIGFPTKKKRKKRENGEPSSEGRPPVFGRLAEARISARTEPVKEGWRIWVRIVPTEDTQPKDLTYLSFGIDEDSDTGVAGNWLTPVDVFVDGKPGKTKDRIISLGKLASLTYS